MARVTPPPVAILEPRTALAYERSELVADETAARVAALSALAERPGADPRGERPGPRPAHDRAGRPAGRAAPARDQHPAPPGRAARGAARSRLRAGRSRLPAGASSPGAAASSTSSRRRRRCRSGSSSSATRSTRCGPSTRPTSGPSGSLEEAVLLPASEFLQPHGGAAALRDAARPARGEAAGAARRGPRAVRRRRGDPGR